MNFLRRVKKRTSPPLDKNGEQLICLYNLVRTHGDEILSGKTKLSLTTPILILLNGTFQKLTEGVNQPCFQVATNGNDTKHVVSFLFEFMQKVVSLKLISGPHSLDCPLLNIDCFKCLQVLEIRKFPIIYLKYLNCIRRQLKGLICFRSTNSLKEVVNSFGKESDELYSLPTLTSLDLSYNTIKEIDDASLRLLPSLEILNLSFNCIKSADSTSLPAITYLNLGFNAISSIPSLPPKVCHSLTTLILRNNSLLNLKGLEALCNLELLDLAANCIVEFVDLDPLAYLQKLLNLSLIDNPISFNPNYVHFTIRKLSPVKRRAKIILDGNELDETVVQYLGQDVQPISLVSYIPEKPMGVPRGSLLNLISSLPKLATSVPSHESSPIPNGRVKQKAPVREAAILDFSSSPEIKNLYEVDTVSYQSSRSSRSSYSDKGVLDTSNLNIVSGSLYTSRRSSVTNSLIWVNTSTGTESKQNDVNVKASVDYASWPVEDTDHDFPDEILLSGSDGSNHNISEDIESNIYGNQSALSLPTLEQEINSSPNDETVVISVVSSDDKNDDGDNDSLRSVSTILSECVDTDCTYLVKNVKRNKEEDIEEEEHLFLIFKLPYLLEKDTNGKIMNKLDLSYLRDVKSGFDRLTLILTFDLMRIDWQYREYVFEEEEHLNSFMNNVQPIAVKNYQKKISEMKHCECLKCANVFLMKEDCYDSLYCTECGSTMVIDKNENHIQQTANRSEGDGAPFGSPSSFGKNERDNFFSVSSIEMEKLINEPDDIAKSNNESCPLISSWPPSKSVTKVTRALRKCSSLPNLGCDQCMQENISDEKRSSSTSRKISSISKHSNSESNKNETLYDQSKLGYKIPLQKTHSNTTTVNSVSSGSSKYSSRLRSSSMSHSSLKSDSIASGVNNYKKCDHRLKLFLSISVYQHEDEEFVCQLMCGCSQYNRIQEYDCLLNISTKSFYLFSITECDSDLPEDCFLKEASCALDVLKYIRYGYYNQSFSLEFAKPGCYYKFVTRDAERTNEFLNLLKDEFGKLDCFVDDIPPFTTEEDKQYLRNIRKHVFCITEDLREMGGRIYEQILSSKAPLLKSQKIRLRTHYQCFIARQLVDWLLAYREVKSRSEGIELCSKLLKIGFIFHVLNKQDTFMDNDELFKFSQTDSKMTVSNSEVEKENSDEEEEMNTTVRLYSLAHVRISESDSTSHKRSIIITQSHIFLINECHQWPLSTLQPPPPLLRDNFNVKASHKLTNVTALEFFEDAPCYANVCFVEEDSPLSAETDWLIQTESSEELLKIVDFIKMRWEALFLIELKVVTHISVIPLLECYVFVDE